MNQNSERGKPRNVDSNKVKNNLMQILYVIQSRYEQLSLIDDNSH